MGRLSPTTWLGLLLLAIGLASVVVGVGWDLFDDWTTNVAVEAFSLAATVFIVERIVRREARARLRPRVENAMDSVTHAFHSLVTSIGVDYLETHVGTHRDLPPDLTGIIDHWLEFEGEADAERRAINGVPSILRDADSAAQRFEAIRTKDADVLEPNLVAALDDLAGVLSNLRFVYELLDQLHADSDHSGTIRSAVEAAQSFAVTYLQQDGAEPILESFSADLLRGVRHRIQEGEE